MNLRNKRFAKTIAVILCLAMMLPALFACSGGGSAIVVSDKKTGLGITESMFSYWLSYYKTEFLNSYGYQEDPAELWAMDTGEGTLGELLNKSILDNVKYTVAAAVLYKNSGQELSKELLGELDQTIKDMAADFGSEKLLNEELKKYGADAKVLKKILEFEETYMALHDYLYNTDTGTSKISDADVSASYEERSKEYVRIKHILINTLPPEEAAADGTGSAANDALDALTGTDDTDDTTPVADDAQTQYEAKLAQLKDIQDKIAAGEDFESFLDQSEDPGTASYPDGYFFRNDGSMVQEFADAAFDMAVGEVRSVETAYGTHVMKKYEITQETYMANVENVRGILEGEAMTDLIVPIVAELTIDETALAKFDISKAAVMFAEG